MKRQNGAAAGRGLVFFGILVLLMCLFSMASANGTYDTATEVVFGTEYSDANQESSSWNPSTYPARCWYKMTVPESGKISIQFDAVRHDIGWFYLELYNDKVELMTQFEHGFNATTNEVMGTDHMYLKAGNYYFCIYGRSSGWYPLYTFTLKFTHEPTGETLPESTANSNDTYGTATPVQLNTEYKEQISTYGDRVDHYRFTLEVEGKLKIWSKAFMERILITLKDEQGTQKWTANPLWNDFVGYSENSGEVVLPAGTYYLDFESTRDAKRVLTSGIYLFRLSAEAEEHTVTVTVNDEKAGTASADPVSGKAGTVITLTAKARTGYLFRKWEVISGDVTIADNRFTMGTSDVEIRAVFEKMQDSVTSGGLKYKLDHQAKTATVTGPAKKSMKKAEIQATVKANGLTYQVTAIAANAFSGLKKLTQMTIGKNVKSIGKSAFQNCGKLKTIRILTKLLKTKNVGAGAFEGIAKNATLKCPKGYAGKYEKILRKKGVPDGAKFQ